MRRELGRLPRKQRNTGGETQTSPKKNMERAKPEDNTAKSRRAEAQKTSQPRRSRSRHLNAEAKNGRNVQYVRLSDIRLLSYESVLKEC